MIDKALEILKPPVDNLYKFKAISGLTLILSTIVFLGFIYYLAAIENSEINKSLVIAKRGLGETSPLTISYETSVKELSEDADQLKTEVEAYRIDVTAYASVLEAIKKEIKNASIKSTPNQLEKIKADLNSITTESIKAREKRIEDLITQINSQQEARDELKNKIRSKMEEVNTSIGSADQKLESTIFYKNTIIISFFSLIPIILGFYQSYRGFHDWQIKVQNYQDEILVLQVEEIKKNLGISGDLERPIAEEKPDNITEPD